jgi:branched-subunit amino acid transport protein
MSELWLLALACAAGTYLWRGLGVLLSGRIEVDGELFRWATCVAYAMVAGLIVRIIVMPTGMLDETQLVDRLAASALGIAGYYFSRKNIFVGVIVGVIAIVIAGHLRGLFG